MKCTKVWLGLRLRSNKIMWSEIFILFWILKLYNWTIKLISDRNWIMYMKVKLFFMKIRSELYLQINMKLWEKSSELGMGESHYLSLLSSAIKQKWTPHKFAHLLNNSFLKKIIIIINMFLLHFLVQWKVSINC
jgi:hypothetical protein